jgi:hypothetical protein
VWWQAPPAVEGKANQPWGEMSSNDAARRGPGRRDSLSSRPGSRAIWQQTCVLATQIADRIAQAAVEDLRARYELGRLVHDLRYDGTDHEILRDLSRLGVACGLAAATLRRYARVSETINPNEFGNLTRPRGPRGPSLTWSHIEELAEARSSEVRRRCAEAAISESLSVSALRARVRAASTDDDGACQRGTIDDDARDER